MELQPTDEQRMLRDSVASYLADHYAFDQRRAIVEQEPGWRPQVWKAFAEELGILGAAFPEPLGGLGGGAVETMIIMEAFGGALVVAGFMTLIEEHIADAVDGAFDAGPELGDFRQRHADSTVSQRRGAAGGDTRFVPAARRGRGMRGTRACRKNAATMCVFLGGGDR